MLTPKPQIQDLKRVQETETSRFYKVRLDRSERTHPFSSEFIDRIRSRIDGDWIMTYPEPEPLYQQLARFLNLSRDCLLLNNGSDQSIKAIFETFVGPQDRVLLHQPGYAMYPVYAQMFGARTEAVEWDSNLHLDFDRFLCLVRPGLRLAVLENPNGFIGAAPPEAALRAFIERCERHGVVAVVDEAYYFFHEVTVAQWLNEFENLIVVRTFSKALGGAGLRAGYTIAHPDVINHLRKVKPMHEVNGLAVLVLLELLNCPEEIFSFVRSTRDSLKFLKSGLTDLGFRVSDSVANFLAAELGSRLEGASVSARCREVGILLRRPFREPTLTHWTRIGTGPIPEMQRVLDLLKSMLEGKERQCA